MLCKDAFNLTGCKEALPLAPVVGVLSCDATTVFADCSRHQFYCP